MKRLMIILFVALYGLPAYACFYDRLVTKKNVKLLPIQAFVFDVSTEDKDECHFRLYIKDAGHLQGFTSNGCASVYLRTPDGERLYYGQMGFENRGEELIFESYLSLEKKLIEKSYMVIELRETEGSPDEGMHYSLYQYTIRLPFLVEYFGRLSLKEDEAIEWESSEVKKFMRKKWKKWKWKEVKRKPCEDPFADE